MTGTSENIAARADLLCPNCHSTDQVHYVPNVHRAGWSNYTAGGWAGSVVTALSAELDPRPRVRGQGGLPFVGLCFLLLAGVTLLMILVSNVPVLFVWVVVSATIGIAFLVPYFRANRWRGQVNAAMPRIYDVWQRAWFCQRCGGVFFPAREAAVGLPTGRLLSTGELRYLLRPVGGIQHVS
jgi:hypothetical protein